MKKQNQHENRIKKESNAFLDTEYDRIKNAKKKFLGRIDLEKKSEICEHMAIENFLLEDHDKQYENL